MDRGLRMAHLRCTQEECMIEIDKCRWMIVSDLNCGCESLSGGAQEDGVTEWHQSAFMLISKRPPPENLHHDLATPLCHTIDSCKADIISMPFCIIQSVQRACALCQRVPWGLLITATNLMASVSSRIALPTSRHPHYVVASQRKRGGTIASLRQPPWLRTMSGW